MINLIRLFSPILIALLVLPNGGLATLSEDPSSIKPLEVGEAIPNVSIQASNGEPASFEAIVEGKKTVLIFYRGGWCPYCMKHLSSLMEVEDRLQELGYQLIAISPDRPEKLNDSLEANPFAYEIYSDSEMNLAKAFGLAFRVDDETLKMLNDYGIDLEEASGKEHRLLPVPAVYLINEEGTINYRYYNPDYSIRLSAEEILQAAEASE